MKSRFITKMKANLIAASVIMAFNGLFIANMLPASTSYAQENLTINEINDNLKESEKIDAKDNSVDAKNNSVPSASDQIIIDNANDLNISEQENGNFEDESILAPTTLTTQVGKYEITAAGNMPEGAELSAKRVYNIDELEEVIDNDDYSIYVAFDIKILVNGEVWQPVDDGEAVTITATNIEIPEGEELTVYRIENEALEFVNAPEETVVKLNAVETTDGDIEVETEHFTTYTFGGVPVNVDGTAAYLVSGKSFNVRIKNLINSKYTYYTSSLQPFKVTSSADEIIESTIYDIVWTDTDISKTGKNIAMDAGLPVYAQKAEDSNGNTIIELYTEADEVYFNRDCNNMFVGLTGLNHVSFFNSKINTSLTVDMSYLFNGMVWYQKQGASTASVVYRLGQTHLKDINLMRFNTSKVTDMEGMFSGCSSLTDLDVSNFDTSQVTTMTGMFYDCGNLVSLDVSNFNTSQVKEMGDYGGHGMFEYCTKLESLDLSNFDTHSVESMQYMFKDCPALTSLDLSHFNTANVTDMSYMFQWCTNLANLNIRSFNTSKVKRLDDMFYYCQALQTLDVSNFNTTSVTLIDDMFYKCTGLVSLDISNFDLSNVTSASNMLGSTTQLQMLKAPKTIPSTLSISLPIIQNKSWYIDDNRDYVVDTKTTYTGLIHGIADEPHTYIRNDIEGFMLSTTEAYLIPGPEFNVIIKNLADNGTTYDSYAYRYTSYTNDRHDCVENTIKDIAWTTTDLSSKGINVAISGGVPVYAAKETNAEGETIILLFTEADIVYFNPNASSMFALMTGLEQLSMLKEKISTEQTTSMAYMFGGRTIARLTSPRLEFINTMHLQDLDLSRFSTTQTKDFSYMFSGCASLTNLNVSIFNTANATTFAAMFEHCKSLSNIDVSNFNTSHATTMWNMFGNCEALQVLDVSNFNTTNVTDTCSMFSHCTSLATLDLSNFNTSKVTHMGWMFSGCKNLVELDISNFTTSQVRNMNTMFSYCSSLTSLDVSAFDTNQVTDIAGMFGHCSSLTSLNLSGFNTENVSTMKQIFSGCSALVNLDVSNWNTENVIDMSNMFDGCSSLTNLNVSNFNTANVTDMHYMFNNCSSLTSLNLSNFNTSNITNMSGMFDGCSKLTNLDISNFNTANVTNMSYMFYGCSSPTSLDVSGFNTSNVTNLSGMFDNCSSLTNLDLSNFNTVNVTNMSGMFYGCSSLTSLDLSSFDLTNVVSGKEFTLSKLIKANKIKAPATILEGQSISLPSVIGKSWYLDDTDPQLEADTNTTYTQLINGTINESHTYIRNDIEGFSVLALNTKLATGATVNAKLKTLTAGGNKTYTDSDNNITQIIKVPYESEHDNAVNIAADGEVSVYAKPIIKSEEKYSHTSNISDDGTQSGNYANNLRTKDVITIPGATKLHVTLTYGTESGWDQVFVFQGTYTGSVTRDMTQGQLAKYQGNNNSPVTVEFDVESDTVTFAFYSDGSSNYYGYYAKIEDANPSTTGQVTGIGIYTEADNILANEDCSHMFENFEALETYMFYDLDMSLTTDTTDMFKGSNELKTLASPKVIPDGLTVVLPTKGDYKWYLDDELPMNELDSKTAYTSWITGTTEPHMYIRSDRDGFSDKFTAYLRTGRDINTAMIHLANDSGQEISDPLAGEHISVNTTIDKVVWTDEDISTEPEIINIAISNSRPVYMLYRNGSILLHTDADIVYLNSDSANLFAHLAGLTDYSFITDEKVSFEQVTNAQTMFMFCQSLTQVVIDKETPLLSNILGMFYGCSNLKEIDISNFSVADNSLSSIVGNRYGTNSTTYTEGIKIRLIHPDLGARVMIPSLIDGCNKLRTIKAPKNIGANAYLYIDTVDYNSFKITADTDPFAQPSDATGTTTDWYIDDNGDQIADYAGKMYELIPSQAQSHTYVKMTPEGVQFAAAEATLAEGEQFFERIFDLSPLQFMADLFMFGPHLTPDGSSIPDFYNNLYVRDIKWSDAYFDSFANYDTARIDDGSGAPVYARVAPVSVGDEQRICSSNLTGLNLLDIQTGIANWHTSDTIPDFICAANTYEKSTVTIKNADYLIIDMMDLGSAVNGSTDMIAIVPGDFDGTKEEIAETLASYNLSNNLISYSRTSGGAIHTDSAPIFIVPGDTVSIVLSTDDNAQQGVLGYLARVRGCSYATDIELYTDASKVYLNENCDFMFAGPAKNPGTFLKTLDSSNVVSMEEMFAYNKQVTDIDLSSMNMHNVEDMSGMFYQCSSLENVNLDVAGNPSVTSMRFIFFGCNSLREVDLSKLSFYEPDLNDGETNIEGAFFACTNLSKVKLPQNINYLGSRMFDLCFNLSSVSGCQNIVLIDDMAFNASFEKEIAALDWDEIQNADELIEHCRERYNIDIAPYNSTQKRYLFFEDYKVLTADCWKEYDWDGSQRVVQVYETSVPATLNLTVKEGVAPEFDVTITKYLQNDDVNISLPESIQLQNEGASNSLAYAIALQSTSGSETEWNSDSNIRYTKKFKMTPDSNNNYLPDAYTGSIAISLEGAKQRITP